MTSSLQVGNVLVELGPEVSVSVDNDGKITLGFSKFTGTMTLTPDARRGAVRPLDDGESSGEMAKKARLETPEDDEEGNSGELGAAVSAMRTIPQEVFRNGGGLSQDSDDDEPEAAPRVISWEEAIGRSSSSPAAPGADDADASGVAPSADDVLDSASAGGAAAAPAAQQRSPAAALGAGGSSASKKRQAAASRSPAASSGAGVLSPWKGGAGAGGSSSRAADSPLAGRDTDAAAAPPAAPGPATDASLAFPFSPSDSLDAWEWQKVATEGEAPPPRWGHTCVNLGGHLYVMGGDDLTDSDHDILSDLFKFDPSTRQWRKCRDAPQGRCWHSGTVVGGSVEGNSDILLVFGGETLKPGTSTRAPLNSMLSYDPEFEIWYDAVDRGVRPSARLGHAAAVHTANGDGASEKLVVFGGWSGRKYAEPELRELHIGADWAWRRVLSGGQPPHERAYHTATKLARDRLLVFGGHDAELNVFTHPVVLDLTCMAWTHPTVSGEPPSPRTCHAAVCLDGWRVLIHGGWEPNSLGAGEETYTLHSDLSILDTDAWVWSKPKVHGATPCARVGHSLVACTRRGGGQAMSGDDSDDSDDDGGGSAVGAAAGPALYAFGGRADGDTPLNDTYVLRPMA